MNYWTQSKNNIYVAAHRGWCSKYPENTMAAFKAAIELGVDQIETDVRITKDGELVLMHDNTVDRTTNGSGRVIDMTLAELKSLDAGNGEKVPTFLEFMELVKNHPTLTLDLELKIYPYDEFEELSYEVCDRTLKIVDDYGFTDRIVINSFSSKLNEYIYKKYGKKYRQHVFYPLRVLTPDSEICPYYYAYCACVSGEDKRDYEYLDKCGVQPWVGAGVNNAERIEKAIENGVMLITCNNPDEVLAILREKGYHK